MQLPWARTEPEAARLPGLPRKDRFTQSSKSLVIVIGWFVGKGGGFGMRSGGGGVFRSA